MIEYTGLVARKSGKKLMRCGDNYIQSPDENGEVKWRRVHKLTKMIMDSVMLHDVNIHCRNELLFYLNSNQQGDQ